jgi:hypothetical protein
MIVKRKSRKRPRFQESQDLPWPYFDLNRTIKAGGDYRPLLDNFVTFNLPAGASHRDVLEKIASESSHPFRIDSLDKSLDQPIFLRAQTNADDAGFLIDRVVRNYGGSMRWWMSEAGLVIAKVGPEDVALSEFDRKAGELWMKHSLNGRLLHDGLVKVCAQLDAAGLPFIENLELSQRRVFQAEAQRTKKAAPPTFSQAVSSLKLSARIRVVRQRLLRAKERYKNSVYGSNHVV